MNNYKITIQYDGSRYKGWQRLGNGENTIQDKIEQVLTRMIGTEIEITGCSRTDAGVHALGQVANFKCPAELEPDSLGKYLNHYLPEDISITHVEQVPEIFHSRYHCKKKTYLYRIWNKEYSHPFARKYSMHVVDILNVEAMKEAGTYFLGEHDFTSFSNAKSKKKSMVRTIHSIDITEKDGFIDIRICGDGFLYNMVRWMVGALIDVGIGKKNSSIIPLAMEAKQRGMAGDLADACGLFLEGITY